MPRLRQVSRGEAGGLALKMYELLFPGRDPVSKPGTSTGTPGNWWTVFALVPDCLQHAVDGFRFYRDPKRKLDPQLRELAQTRAGFARGSQFVFSQHCKAARSVGLSEAKVKLRCPISQREFEWDRFCYFRQNREQTAWPQESH